MVQVGKIGHFISTFSSWGFLKSFDHFEDRGSAACTQIVDFHSNKIGIKDLFYSCHMTVSQVHNMNVIPKKQENDARYFKAKKGMTRLQALDYGNLDCQAAKKGIRN